MTEHTNVVIWSGGADSTLLLEQLAMTRNKVVAITIGHDPSINPRQLAAQATAQRRYIERAERLKYDIDHIVLAHTVTPDPFGDALTRTIQGTPTRTLNINNGGQMLLWLSLYFPYIQMNDVVHLGYIEHDSFWHFRSDYKRAFNTLAQLAGISCTLQFDLEWCSKSFVLNDLKRLKVPKTCWWSCEEPTSQGARCKKCNKCKEIEGAS